MSRHVDQPAADPEQAQDLLLDLFVRLRRGGLSLGIPELLDARRAMASSWWRGDVKRLASRLWCKGWDDRRELDLAWTQVASLADSEAREESARKSKDSNESEAAAEVPRPEVEDSVSGDADGEASAMLGELPVQAPPESRDLREDFTGDWPLTRRSMLYGWRFLRRYLADGPADVLDIRATVDHAARQGFYLAPVWRRREQNHAHLILLVDHGGSMVPFHRFSRDLVQTAQEDADLGQVEVYTFHNVFGERLDDPVAGGARGLGEILAGCDTETSILLVSDAGSARGGRNIERIFATVEALAKLRRSTPRVAWLNPMPVDRWAGSSAQWISLVVPMFAMDPDGFSNAVDVLRGQTLGVSA